jgi:hypothetical protein
MQHASTFDGKRLVSWRNRKLLTQWSRILLETFAAVQPITKYPTLYGTPKVPDYDKMPAEIKKTSIFSKKGRPALGPNQRPIRWVRGSLCPRIKRTGVWLTTHLQSVFRLKMSGAISPRPPYAFRVCKGHLAWWEDEGSKFPKTQVPVYQTTWRHTPQHLTLCPQHTAYSYILSSMLQTKLHTRTVKSTDTF